MKAPFVGKNSKKFPDGAEVSQTYPLFHPSPAPQFGMYSNGCGVPDWTYTGVKHWEKICCNKGVLEECKTNLG